MDRLLDNAAVRRAATLRPYEREPVRVLEPTEPRAPLIFTSPHSGKDYDPRFLAASRLDPLALRRSEDVFIDEIFGAAPGLGAPLLLALFPRAFLDPNREPFELDPSMFADALPSFVKTRTDRVRAGFGTIARIVSTGAEIYRERLRFAEAEARVRTLYQPYHDTLERLIETTLERFGVAIIIDCHSMPSVGGPSDKDPGQPRTDFVLGDRHGSSCAPLLTALAETTLRRLGYQVTRNDPYAGAHTLIRYGRPDSRVHALQIEINRALYVDEARLVKLPGFAELTRHMTQLIKALAGLDRASL